MMMRCLENILSGFMSVKRSLLIALAINLFFLVLCVLFGDLRFGAIDDYFMAAVLTGAHGDSYNPLIVFVNGTLNIFIISKTLVMLIFFIICIVNICPLFNELIRIISTVG